MFTQKHGWKFIFLAMLFFTSCMNKGKEETMTTDDQDEHQTADQMDQTSPEKVLIFHKTMGYRHESIEAGTEVLKDIIKKEGFEPVVSEDSTLFQENNLKTYAAVIFLSTTGNILDETEQNEFTRYIEAGGGYLGIHAAADTEYDWPWYNGLVGGYFSSHPNNPNVRKALVIKTKNNQAATDSLPDSFERTDEWYNYRDLDSTIIPLLKLDETSYEGGTMNGDHPITWYHEYDGGKAFYTGFGHTEETYDEPGFRQLIRHGLEYVAADHLNFQDDK